MVSAHSKTICFSCEKEVVTKNDKCNICGSETYSFGKAFRPPRKQSKQWSKLLKLVKARERYINSIAEHEHKHEANVYGFRGCSCCSHFRKPYVFKQLNRHYQPGIPCVPKKIRESFTILDNIEYYDRKSKENINHSRHVPIN